MTTGSNAFEALRNVNWREEPDVSLREWRVNLPLARGGRALAFEYADYRGMLDGGARSAIVSVVDEQGIRGKEAVLGEAALTQLLALLAHSTLSAEPPEPKLEPSKAGVPCESREPRSPAPKACAALIIRLRELSDMGKNDWHGLDVPGVLRGAADLIEELALAQASRVEFRNGYYASCAENKKLTLQREHDLAWKQRAEASEATIAEAEEYLRSATNADGDLGELVGWLEIDRGKAAAERDAEVAAGQFERDRAIKAEAELAASERECKAHDEAATAAAAAPSPPAAPEPTSPVTWEHWTDVDGQHICKQVSPIHVQRIGTMLHHGDAAYAVLTHNAFPGLIADRDKAVKTLALSSWRRSWRSSLDRCQLRTAQSAASVRCPRL